MPKPSAPRNGDEVALPANRAKGKSFTGSKGGGRYTNVPDAPEGDGPSSPMPNSPGPAAREGHKIQLDMWEVPDPMPLVSLLRCVTGATRVPGANVYVCWPGRSLRVSL